jgi:hypothetical protein
MSMTGTFLPISARGGDITVLVVLPTPPLLFENGDYLHSVLWGRCGEGMVAVPFRVRSFFIGLLN